jgi:ribulose-phosphate 3-epimerase
VDRSGVNVEIEVDGGVHLDNVAQVAAAGADTVVMGAGIFDTPKPAETIGRVRALCAH